MRRYRSTGPIGGLALAVTLVVACTDAPTGVPPHPASAETATQSVTVPTIPLPTGLCPPGFDLVLIALLPESLQSDAKDVEFRRLRAFNELVERGFINILPPGLNDGYVCIKNPPPDDPDKQEIVDNTRPLKEFFEE